MSSNFDTKLVFVGVAGALFGASAAGLAVLVANQGVEDYDEEEDEENEQKNVVVAQGGENASPDSGNDNSNNNNNNLPDRSASLPFRPPTTTLGLSGSVSLSPMDNMPALVGSVLRVDDESSPMEEEEREDPHGIFSPTRGDERIFSTRRGQSLLLENSEDEIPHSQRQQSHANPIKDDDDAGPSSTSKEEEQILLNLLYSIAEDQARREGVVHRGIICNACQRSPVIGVRYKCANCLDYDICEACEPKDHHDPAHVFVKIRVPLPPLSSPRSVLFAPLYVGRRKRGPAALSGGVNTNAYQPLSWTQLKDLVKETQFDHYELESLHEQFFRLCSDASTRGNDSPSAAPIVTGISRENFNDCLGTLAIGNNLVVRRLFRFYDQNDDEVIDFSEMTKGLSVLIKGSLQDKLPHVFRGYDLDDRGSLSKENLRQMFKAYFSLTVELVKDVVRTCEEDMFNSHYDDAAGKPVSALFTAPIPTELGYPAPLDAGNDSGFPRLDSSLSRSNSGIPSSLSALYLSPMSPMLGAVNSDFTQTTQISQVQTPHCRPVGADRADRLSVSNDAEPSKTATLASAIENNLDSKSSIDVMPQPPTSSSTRQKPKRRCSKESNNLGAFIDPTEKTLENASVCEERRCTPMWPVIEAMSQDAVAELVDSFFANAGVGQGERMTYDQFFSLSQSDRSLLAWFEALGTVF